MNDTTTQIQAKAKFSAMWRAIGTVLVLAILLAPVVYRLTWRPQAAAQRDGDVQIEFLVWGNPAQLAAVKAVMQQFNAQCQRQGKHEKVVLFMPPDGGYLQKLLMMFASHTAPDTAVVDLYDFSSLAGKGYFRDLTDLAAADPTFHLSDFHPSVRREDMYRGRLYGLDTLYGGLICYYNADMFRQAGLADPYTLWKQGKWNWTAFDDDARRLTVRDTNRKPVSFGLLLPGAAIGPSAILYSLFLWRFGGHLLTPDKSHSMLGSAPDIKTIQYLRDLVFKSRVMPATGDQAASMFSFESGNIAMTIDTSGNSPYYRDAISTFDWDIAPTPSNPNNRYQVVKGNELIISKQCKHPREAWDWIRYLTSKKAELYLYGDKYRRNVPTRLSVLSSPAFLHSTHPPFHTDIFKYLLDNARELPIDETWPTWTDTMQRFIQRLFADPNASATVIMKEAAKSVNIDIKEQRARYAEMRPLLSGGSSAH